MGDEELRAALDAWERNGAPNRGSLAAFGIRPTLADDVTIGPIQHSNSMCQKADCTCWCQACERHNWRHRESGR